MNSIAVILMTKDRPLMAEEALDSILNQSDSDFHLIVSDNSEFNDFEKICKDKYQSIEYRKRTPVIPSYHQHAIVVSKEVKEKFVLLFHDDDILYPDYIKSVRQVISSGGGVSCVSANAHYMINNIIDSETMIKVKKDIIISSKEEFANYYFAPWTVGVAPLSGYLVRTNCLVRVLESSSEALGKYSDFLYLSHLIDDGPIVWIAHPHLAYRIHSGQDNYSISRADRLKIMALFKKNPDIYGDDILHRYRFLFYFVWFRKNTKLHSACKYPIVLSNYFRINHGLEFIRYVASIFTRLIK
jgi:glycosyltransferase involved in cell wall biosynthesis